jgi:hypothetical protein
MALATLDQFKLQIDVSDTDSDTLLQQLLDIAEKSVLNYVPTFMEQDEVTEYYDGNGQVDLPLRFKPVNLDSTPEVWLDPNGFYGQGTDAFGTSSVQTLGSDFIIVPDGPGQSRSGLLRRLGLGFRVDSVGRPYGSLATRYRRSVWPIGQGNIKVTYTAGYDPVPADVTGAVLQMAALMHRTRLYGGNFLPSERLGEYAYTLTSALQGNGALADQVGSMQMLLRPYLELTI